MTSPSGLSKRKHVPPVFTSLFVLLESGGRSRATVKKSRRLSERTISSPLFIASCLKSCDAALDLPHVGRKKEIHDGLRGWNPHPGDVAPSVTSQTADFQLQVLEDKPEKQGGPFLVSSSMLVLARKHWQRGGFFWNIKAGEMFAGLFCIFDSRLFLSFS